MKCFVINVVLLCCSTVYGQVTDFSGTSFSKADSIAARYADHDLTDLKALTDKLTCTLPTEQEKFRAIYKWVCSDIEADYELLSLNKRKRTKLKGAQLDQWNKKFNKIVFQTLVREHKTICTGYAYLIRAMAVHAGLRCQIINGYARHAGVTDITGPVNHSWNEVQLNGKWYVCDATWSSGVYNLNTRAFTKKYNDLFFLTEPGVFFQSHAAALNVAVAGQTN